MTKICVNVRLAELEKFDIFGLIFYVILFMHMHNNQLVYNFYEQANKGLFRFRMRNEILRRSEKIETMSQKHDFSDRNSPVYVIQ